MAGQSEAALPSVSQPPVELSLAVSQLLCDVQHVNIPHSLLSHSPHTAAGTYNGDKETSCNSKIGHGIFAVN